MALNWEATETHWFVDQENKMMLTQNPGWNPTGGNGKGDAIGRTFIAYYLYGDERFLEGIESCWERVERTGIKRLIFGKYYYQGYRYPHRFPDELGLSRDHLLYTLIVYKYAGYTEEYLKEFTSHLRFRISKFASFTPELWWWKKAISGSKFHLWLYLALTVPVLKVSRWWNKMIYKYVPFEEESHQDDFVLIQNNMKPERIKKWANRLYPIYALHQHAWQLHLLPDSKRKRKAQKIAFDICPKHNYAIQMILGFKDMVDPENVFGFKSMTGGRWTGILNPWINDRDMSMQTNPVRLTANVQDVEYVQKLYNTIHCTHNI